MASPYAPSPSPVLPMPPQKKQKLSPNPPSPYAPSPSTSTPMLSFPTTPGAQTPSQSFPQQLQHAAIGGATSFNQPTSPMDNGLRPTPAPVGTMGPPQKPPEKGEKPMDIDTWNDVVVSAGIDLREEESYLSNTYRNRHQPYSSQSFTGSSFGTDTTSPNTSFQDWNSQQPRNGPFQQGSGGPVHETPQAQRNVEEEITRKHQTAARQLALHRQHHLNDPFLQPRVMRHFIDDMNYKKKLNLTPLGPESRHATYDSNRPVPNTPSGQRADVLVGNINGRPVGIAEARANPVLADQAGLSDILALISLAAQERVRGIFENAFGYSQVRQTTSSGVVSPDWVDLATGEGKEQQTTVISKSITGTAWDRPISQGSQDKVSENTGDDSSPSSAIPRKRPADSDLNPNTNNLPTPPTDTAPSTPRPTVAYSNPLHDKLKAAAAAERRAEDARLAARKRRKTSGEKGDGASTADRDEQAAKEAAEKMQQAPKMTKKEREKAARGAQTEEAQHRNANATAHMALGLGKSYSWMSAARKGGAGAGRPGGSGAPSGASTPRGPGTNTGPPVRAPSLNRERKWGDLKEDSKAGQKVQLRDWARAAEIDGRMKSHSVRVWTSKFRP